MKSISRRQFLFAMFGAGASTAAYARFVEPYWLDISRQEVSIPGGSGTVLSVLHLSDLHASPDVALSYIESAIEQGLALKPQLICLTGDYITHRLQHRSEYQAVLAKLPAFAPTFACMGNHDGGLWAADRHGYHSPREVMDLLQAADITVLHNKSQLITIDDRSIWLAGVGDLWSGSCQPQKAFAKIPPDKKHPVIVLAHNPDSKDYLGSFQWDLMLSGHTHGGQFRIPVFGAPFAPVRDHRFIAGLYRWEKRHLYISRGVGNVRGVRLNCRPEISLLRLV